MIGKLFNCLDGFVFSLILFFLFEIKKKQLVKFKLGNSDEGITILVHSPERKELFHDICCFLNNENYPIYQADIYTTKTNYALDIIKVSSQTALSISDKYFEHMEKKFLDFLVSNNKNKIREKTNPSRQLKSFPIKYTVEIISHNLPDHYYIVITGADKPGILITLTKILSDNKLNIISAKINTLGDRVEDSILVHTKKLKSQAIKNEIVKIDRHESMIRKVLNLGHTIGHALESYSHISDTLDDLKHGEAIVVGLITELYISNQLNNFPIETVNKLKEISFKYFSKINLTDKDLDGIYDLMIYDKKNTKGTVNYVLLDQSGKPIIDQQVNKSVFIDSFTYYGM